MKKPAFRKARASQPNRERGVTMVLVAIAMVAIISIAALSIDVITLYLAKEEAQRSADNAALAAAKIISLSGLTADPSNGNGNWGRICGPDDGTNGIATRTAKAVAGQDAVGGQVAGTINVTYAAGSGGAVGAGTSDCTTLATSAFGVNPLVTVQVIRASLPSFFSRIWGNPGSRVSATATAETFNPSNSGNVGNQSTGTITPVKPRCVKPWVIPNLDPMNAPGCASGTCQPLLNPDGSIHHQGMTLGGFGANGTVGETFWLDPNCQPGIPGTCFVRAPPGANFVGPPAQGPTNLLYYPGQVGTTVLAVPTCTSGDQYEQAIEGCDQPTNYSCGVPGNGNQLDLTRNPAQATAAGVQCLTRQSDTTDLTTSSGQDYLNTWEAPSSYPFQMLAGTANPVALSGRPVSTSISVVSLPIYDHTTAVVSSNSRTDVTFIGFLQVFINAVDQFGNINVTVLNVAGCGNGTGDPVGTPVIGNSPVPVRLITPP
jgi:Flp pilus assembly protein TadG